MNGLITQNNQRLLFKGGIQQTNLQMKLLKTSFLLSPVLFFKFLRNKEMPNYCSGTITFVKPDNETT